MTLVDDIHDAQEETKAMTNDWIERVAYDAAIKKLREAEKRIAELEKENAELRKRPNFNEGYHDVEKFYRDEEEPKP